MHYTTGLCNAVCMSTDNPHTNAILGGYSPQYDVPGIAASLGGDRALADLFSRDKDATYSSAVAHLVPRTQRPHTAEELILLEEHAQDTLQRANRSRKKKYRLTEDQLDLVSIAPESSTITFRLLIAENDADKAGERTTVLRVIYSDSPQGYGPEIAEQMREGQGWINPPAPRDTLSRCVEVRQQVVEAERRLAELVEDERTVFTDAVRNHQVSMYAIQQATASAGVRISQQGVRKLISAPTRGAQP